MKHVVIRKDAESWLRLVFSAKAVEKQGVIRRSIYWVEREIGRDRFVQEVQSRRFHMLECGGQFVVICNQAGLRIIC